MKVIVTVALVLSSISSWGHDIQTICAENSNWEYSSRGYNFTRLGFFSSPAENIFNVVVKQTDRPVLDLAPWLMQDADSYEVTKAGYLIQLHLLNQDIVNKSSGKDLITILQEAATHPATYSKEDLRIGLHNIFQFERTFVKKEVLGLGAFAPVLCNRYPGTKCSSALQVLASHMASRVIFNPGDKIGYSLSLPSLVKRLEIDPTLVQGAAHFALKIMNYMSDPKNTLKDLHLFEDLVASYIATGSTRKDAEDRAWVLIGIYGTRGASVSFMERYITKANLPVFASLYIFSSALGSLDSLTVNSGHMYSYPAEMETRCFYGRPYHFWMAAYLSHYLQTKGFTKKSSIVATHVSGKIYELGIRTVTRRHSIIGNKPLSAPVITSQKNMMFNDAGALWAAGYYSTPNALKFDDGFNMMLDASVEVPAEKEKDNGAVTILKRIPQFDKLVAPEVYLENSLTIIP